MKINPSKTILQPVDRGVDFVGHVIRPWHTTTRKRTINEAVRATNAAALADVHTTANSYFGLLRQSNASHHSRAQLGRALLKRGFSVDRDLTKTFRRAA